MSDELNFDNLKRNLPRLALQLKWPDLQKSGVAAGEAAWRAFLARATDDEIRAANDEICALAEQRSTGLQTPEPRGTGQTLRSSFSAAYDPDTLGASAAAAARDHAREAVTEGDAAAQVCGGIEAERARREERYRALGQPGLAMHGSFYAGEGVLGVIRRATRGELADIDRQLDVIADAAEQVRRRDAEFEAARARRNAGPTEEEQAETRRMLDEAAARAAYEASTEGKLERLIAVNERIAAQLENRR
jgi:hypothetical protein